VGVDLALRTKRLLLRPIPWPATCAIVEGVRLPGWAVDYPDEGDVALAGMVYRSAATSAPDSLDGLTWGHRQVVETTSDLVVGGIGFFGPPEDGTVEVGYGIVRSRRGRGYATEALLAMLALAWSDERVKAVVAETETENSPSQRVLLRGGLRPDGEGSRPGTERYRIDRPS
jgi:[ribosomal protein S5]-alanine N-acetyltransferase